MKKSIREDLFAGFLAKKGREEDFEQFMTDIEPIGDRITFEIDGSKLKEIMYLANEGSLNEAKKKIEEFTQTKIGEISIINDYKTKTRFRYSHENVIGTIGDGEDTPFLTKISKNIFIFYYLVKCSI